MNKLRELRTARGWRQQDLAEKVNTVKSVISRYELGQHEMGAQDIEKFCDIFGCTADYLIGRSDHPYPQISEEESRLLAAYRAASEKDRQTVDYILSEYMQSEEKKEENIG